MTDKLEELIIYLEDGADEALAKQVAEKLLVDITTSKSEMEKSEVVLYFEKEGISLVSEGQSMMGDFSKMIKRLTHNNLSHELLVKAAKIKNYDYEPVVIDATAGMGEDALLLAAAGFKVKLFERDIVVATLLKDALRRASEDEDLSAVVDRMELIEGDSIELMPKLDFVPDIVVLDPMFPKRQKSGLVKKKFQLIHHLEKPCSDEEELLNAALATKAPKVIVKRPAKGPHLGGVKPSYTVEGKTVRYDCIVR